MQKRRLVLLVLASVAAVGCGRSDRSASAPDSAKAISARARWSSSFLPALPLRSLRRAWDQTRHIAAGPGGVIYANTWRLAFDTTRRVPRGGYLIALRDTNSDGRADDIRRFGSTTESGSKGGTGIALNGNELYAEADSTIVRYRLSGNDPVPSGKPEVIVSGLPTKGGHPMHPIAVDSKDLFVNMGSATNSCQVKDREAKSKGRDPCRGAGEARRHLALLSPARAA